LLHAFARHGWVCVSPSYRLRPASYDEMLGDVERVLAWVGGHGGEIGADPRRVVLAGSSAGAHLAVTAALDATAPPHRPHRPDRATAGTGIVAAVGMYGYYGRADAGDPSSRPAAHVHQDAPPVLLAHGAQDTLVPPEGARALAAMLRAGSTSPVVHAELPGAQHGFDLVHSLRFEHVIGALWSFCAWALDRGPVADLPGAAALPGEGRVGGERHG
jgi:acetyl esterase/lipase